MCVSYLAGMLPRLFGFNLEDKKAREHQGSQRNVLECTVKSFVSILTSLGFITLILLSCSEMCHPLGVLKCLDPRPSQKFHNLKTKTNGCFSINADDFVFVLFLLVMKTHQFLSVLHRFKTLYGYKSDVMPQEKLCFSGVFLLALSSVMPPCKIFLAHRAEHLASKLCSQRKRK